MSVKTFRFVGYNFEVETSTAHLHYAFDETHYFEETIVFHRAQKVFSAEEKQAIEGILFFLHLACGISYYKAFVPGEIRIETGSLNQEQAAFFEEFYKKGLGEFAWRNQLDLSEVIKFPYSTKASHNQASNLKLPSRIAVPIGGGKDSSVVLETLKMHGEKVVCIAQGRPRPIRESIAVSGVEDIEFTRTIAPELIALNGQAGVYNGHVPISGVYAFCMTLAAVLYGYNQIAMGNERSANVGNLVREDKFEVNHQWSKSMAFEKSFNDFSKHYMLQNFNYFSLLRPLSELDIASRFAKLKQYFMVFTSCNKAFRIDKEKRLERWCGDCDKCRFVFLALAPFMEKADLIKAVGRNILDEAGQINGFEELLGLSNHKPFECVGELEECVVALHLLSQKKDWAQAAVVQTLYPLILKKYGLAQIKKWQEQVFTPSSQHLLSPKFEGYLLCK